MQASTTPEGRLLEVKKRFAKFFGASASGGDHGSGGGDESRAGESPNQRHSESNDQIGDERNAVKAAASWSPSASSSYLDPVGAKAQVHGQAYGMVSQSTMSNCRRHAKVNGGNLFFLLHRFSISFVF